MNSELQALAVPAQQIPVPRSISPQAQAFLSLAAKRIATVLAAGEQRPNLVATGVEAALKFIRPLAEKFKGTVETLPLAGGAQLYRVTPAQRTTPQANVTYLDIHGGGFISGGGEMCRLLAMVRAADYGAQVHALDYRLMPEHLYPAALDDCMAAYRLLLAQHQARQIVIGGSSAGSNLAAALCLRARDEGLPLPAGLLLLTPVLDLSLSGDSHQTNRYLDVNLYGGFQNITRYAGTADKTLPYVSPLFGDFSKGWPPTFLSSGTRDLLLSDTVRMHRALRRAAVPAELYLTEAGPHAGFLGAFAPEDLELLAECKRFVKAAWAAAS
ncbi:Acetyl esterase/lipase [Solimonas aquatica]|uniref:Acetyl esterase/lipase n=1 Tax=Solimonas aquatica TaxID=489703 RepID=A0A1H9IQZ5_9GAMM|nr:alpha/beta hydrolase fold domain-containing protein [Solimonas aquatica]SEQ76986.1 Acetyl esterase/lipase [Solimonas aquatica]